MTPQATSHPLQMESRGKAPPHISVAPATLDLNPVSIVDSRGEAPALETSCTRTAIHHFTHKNPVNLVDSRGKAPAQQMGCIETSVNTNTANWFEHFITI